MTNVKNSNYRNSIIKNIIRAYNRKTKTDTEKWKKNS